MKKRWYQHILIVILIGLLSACGASTPPKEFAPDGEIVKKAIALQLNQTEQQLSQQLKVSNPKLKISKINVKRLEPLFINKLSTYHLQGIYNLKIKLPRQKITQGKNLFDIYLQRQAEGETWRLLKQKNYHSHDNKSEWKSYLIE